MEKQGPAGAFEQKPTRSVDNDNIIRQEWESFERVLTSALQNRVECFALILDETASKKSKTIDFQATLQRNFHPDRFFTPTSFEILGASIELHQQSIKVFSRRFIF